MCHVKVNTVNNLIKANSYRLPNSVIFGNTFSVYLLIACVFLFFFCLIFFYHMMVNKDDYYNPKLICYHLGVTDCRQQISQTHTDHRHRSAFLRIQFNCHFIAIFRGKLSENGQFQHLWIVSAHSGNELSTYFDAVTLLNIWVYLRPQSTRGQASAWSDLFCACIWVIISNRLHR